MGKPVDTANKKARAGQQHDAMPNWAASRSWRKCCCERVPVLPRDPPLSDSLISTRVLHHAGAMPESTAVTKEATMAKPSTRYRAKNRRVSKAAVLAAQPGTRPAGDEEGGAGAGGSEQETFGGDGFDELETRGAERTADRNSRARDIARARSRLARLAQAMRSTKPDRPTSSQVVVSPTPVSVVDCSD